MTHAQLVDAAALWLARRRGGMNCAFVLTEYRTWLGGETPDAIGWDPYGASVLVECKASRGDLLADRKKKHRAGGGFGQRRFYFCPPGVATAAELDNGWGLVVVTGRGCRIERAAAYRSDFDCDGERRLLLNVARRACRYQVRPRLRAYPEKA